MSVKPRNCERCKAEIALERLEALPETRLCIACSKDVGGEFSTSMSQTSLGKAGSLKKNYGDVTVHRKRKRIEPLK